MKQRLITAFFGFAVLIPVLIFSDTLALPVAVAFFSALGVYEMLGCVGVRKHLEITIPSMLIAAAGPVAVRYLTVLTDRLSYNLAVISAVSFIYMFYLMCVTVVSKG